MYFCILTYSPTLICHIPGTCNVLDITKINKSREQTQNPGNLTSARETT